MSPQRPSLGRIVHVYRYGAPPCCAIITGVIDGDHVNLVAFEIFGLTFELDVPFWSSDDGREPVVSAGDRVFWIWPPVFQ